MNQDNNSNLNNKDASDNQTLNDSFNNVNDQKTGDNNVYKQQNLGVQQFQTNISNEFNQNSEQSGNSVNTIINDNLTQQVTQSNNYANTQETNKHKKNIVGLIIGITIGAIVLIVGVMIAISLLLGKLNSIVSSGNNVFYAEGYSLTYDSNWSKRTLKTTTGEEEYDLMYKNKDIILFPVGDSALSSFEEEYNFDFKTDSGKKKLYDIFYSYWNSETFNVYSGSDGFSTLTDDIYYATMDYTSSKYNQEGQLYLIVDMDSNIVISLRSIINNNFDGYDDIILKVLKTISIARVYDDEQAGILDSMSAWNQYSDLRQGKLGEKKDINGGWKTLSDSQTYWVFKNGEFWWYQSKDDLNDNYWYGKTKILTGKSGLKKVGIDEDRVEYITANTGGKVTSDDIYTIIFTPTKIISDGVDKSSTNITGEDWHMVWVIVDHGSEGLEAQVLNVKTGVTTFLVKLSD